MLGLHSVLTTRKQTRPFSRGVDQAPICAFRVSTFASATVTSSTPARHNPSSLVAPHHQTPPRHDQTSAAPSPCRARPPRTRQRGAGRGKGLSGGGGLKVHCGRHHLPEARPSRPPDGRFRPNDSEDAERLGISNRSFDSEFRLGVSTRRSKRDAGCGQTRADSDRLRPARTGSTLTRTDSDRLGPTRTDSEGASAASDLERPDCDHGRNPRGSESHTPRSGRRDSDASVTAARPR